MTHFPPRAHSLPSVHVGQISLCSRLPAGKWPRQESPLSGAPPARRGRTVVPSERRWSCYKSTPRLIQPAKPPEPWRKPLWINTYSAIFVFAYLIAFAVLMPLIKLGLFHWQAWDRWKRGNKGEGIAIVFVSCCLFDVAIISALVLVSQGKLVW